MFVYMLQFRWLGGEACDIFLRTGEARGTERYLGVLYRIMRVLYGHGLIPVDFDTYGHVVADVVSRGVLDEGIFEGLESRGDFYCRDGLGSYFFNDDGRDFNGF